MSVNSSISFALKNLIVEYCKAYPQLRQNNESLSNLDFNMECGLKIKVPKEWGPDAAIADVIKQFRGVLIIYTTALHYEELFEIAGDRAKYISWHEIYYAIYNKSRDVRPLQKVNRELDTEVVVVSNTSNVDQETLCHIQTFATGCLICLE